MTALVDHGTPTGHHQAPDGISCDGLPRHAVENEQQAHFRRLRDGRNHPAVAPALKADYPEVETFTRLAKTNFFINSVTLSTEDKKGEVKSFNEEKMYLADSARRVGAKAAIELARAWLRQARRMLGRRRLTRFPFLRGQERTLR